MSNFKINDEVRTNENVPVTFTGHVTAITPAGQIQVRNSRGDVGTFDAASLEPADSLAVHPDDGRDIYVLFNGATPVARLTEFSDGWSVLPLLGRPLTPAEDAEVRRFVDAAEANRHLRPKPGTTAYAITTHFCSRD